MTQTDVYGTLDSRTQQVSGGRQWCFRCYLLVYPALQIAANNRSSRLTSLNNFKARPKKLIHITAPHLGSGRTFLPDIMGIGFEPSGAAVPCMINSSNQQFISSYS